MNLSIMLTEEEAEWLRYALRDNYPNDERARHLDRVVREIDSAFWRNSHTCWKCLAYKDEDECQCCNEGG